MIKRNKEGTRREREREKEILTRGRVGSTRFHWGFTPMKPSLSRFTKLFHSRQRASPYSVDSWQDCTGRNKAVVPFDIGFYMVWQTFCPLLSPPTNRLPFPVHPVWNLILNILCATQGVNCEKRFCLAKAMLSGGTVHHVLYFLSLSFSLSISHSVQQP